MLIVVAIIAILIAISIPLVSSALENARVATDEANERSAKAAALLAYMTYDVNEHTPGAGGGDPDDEESLVYKALTTDGAAYNAVSGKLEDAGTDVKQGYGKCLKPHNLIGTTTKTAAHTGLMIAVKVTDEGEVIGGWVEANGTVDVADAAQGHLLPKS